MRRLIDNNHLDKLQQFKISKSDSPSFSYIYPKKHLAQLCFKCTLQQVFMVYN